MAQTTGDDQQPTVTNTNYNEQAVTQEQDGDPTKHLTPIDFNSHSEHIDLLNQSIQQSNDDTV
jgi:hypothetical protein